MCPACAHIPDDGLTAGQRCGGCDTAVLTCYEAFPAMAYEYAVLIEDQYQRPISQVRKAYFELVKHDNSWERWMEGGKGNFPEEEWHPLVVLLFWSLYEYLLNHFLWKVATIRLHPSKDAAVFGEFLLERARNTHQKLELYQFLTSAKWKDDVRRLGFDELDRDIWLASAVRNEFVHQNPHAGARSSELPDRLRAQVPRLFALFKDLSNAHFHPRAKVAWQS